MKALIVLVWLCVPLTGYLLLRQDWQRYDAATRVQRADCLGRSEYLRRYSVELWRQAELVVSIEDTETRVTWQRAMQITEAEMEREGQGLRPVAPTYYPSTDATLLELDKLLTDEQAQIEDAMRRRDAYIKAGGGLLDLARDIDRARSTAQFYQRIGAQGIYLLLMEDLAQLEAQHDKRLSERNRLAQAGIDALDQARKDKDEILRRLDGLKDALAADEQGTYTQALLTRWQKFNLREEIKHIVLSQATPATR
jgi:hypothetical protein